jgi:biotin transport system substrate-specific component
MTGNSAALIIALTSGTTAARSHAIQAASVLFLTTVTAAAAQVSIPLPFTPVPLTLQPTIVLLAGLALGSRLGAASQLLYLAAGIAGLPVFAASTTLPPGALRLLGPTGGYLLAYPLAAFVAGWLAERGLDRTYRGSLAAMAAGLLLIYAGGVLWLAWFVAVPAGTTGVGLKAALVSGLYPFIVADVIKLAGAATVSPVVWRIVGDGRRPRIGG